MTLALYRAYRPGTLAEVVGQEHVTAPLRRALATGRIHHAYLFSGPRGCGKTSTARIMARSLNCGQGPTPDPCGLCDSCVALAPNGPGSPDVVELDAASHGGVDDTRELRERVAYSPASSRYRVYIIDEAHMVTTQGFNALLKVIEEPPDYVRFIFATTEPEKVLGTIRSRTFNYAFRLVSVKTLSAHLAGVCEAENVRCEPAALTLVARAGGGSVRDALSIMGQLIAGSDDDGLTTRYVSAGLGLTDQAQLDGVMAAIAARDGAAAFTAVDSVIESGHDGRRFLTDLLGRLRDLIVLQHLTDEQLGELLQVPPDQVEVLRAQADLFGPSELSRAADLVSVGLSELKGATAPRLQLELLLARLLLPAADDGAAGLAARLDQLERNAAAAARARGRARRPARRHHPPQSAPTAAAAPPRCRRDPPAPRPPTATPRRPRPPGRIEAAARPPAGPPSRSPAAEALGPGARDGPRSAAAPPPGCGPAPRAAAQPPARAAATATRPPSTGPRPGRGPGALAGCPGRARQTVAGGLGAVGVVPGGRPRRRHPDGQRPRSGAPGQHPRQQAGRAAAPGADRRAAARCAGEPGPGGARTRSGHRQRVAGRSGCGCGRRRRRPGHP